MKRMRIHPYSLLPKDPHFRKPKKRTVIKTEKKPSKLSKLLARILPNVQKEKTNAATKKRASRKTSFRA